MNLNISSPGSYGFEGSLAYDGSVSLVSMSAGTGGWKLEQNGSRVVVYDDALSNPLGNNSTVIKAVFKVNNVATGTGINILSTILLYRMVTMKAVSEQLNIRLQ